MSWEGFAALCSAAAVVVSVIALIKSVRQEGRNKEAHGWSKEDRESGSYRWEVEREPEDPSRITLRNKGTTVVRSITVDDGDGRPLAFDEIKPGHIECFELRPGSLDSPLVIATITWTAPGESSPREYQIRD